MSNRAFDTETIIDDADFAPGTRVRIHGKPVGVTLNSQTGTIIKAGEWDGYFIVHLDAPALYHRADGRTEPIYDVREAADNLTLLPSSAA